jgi:1-acyl-sn-glycerol-3-phosphate acyltransferase
MVSFVGLFGSSCRSLKLKRDFSRATYRGLLRILGVKLKVEGVARDGGVLNVANHVGYLDMAALGSLFTLGFVAKAELKHWPVIGFLTQAVGTLFLKREDAKAVQLFISILSRHLHQGFPWAVFPEGTSSSGNSVLPFHSALFESACFAKIPIQPVAIQYQDARGVSIGDWAGWYGDKEFLPHLWELFGRPGWTLRMAYLETFFSTHRKSAAETARDSIVKQLSDWNFGTEEKRKIMDRVGANF